MLEFLDLKDEYSESDLKAALSRRLEDFLLELGEGFTLVGRQRRLRIDQTWYGVDLLFFHRKLGCLVQLCWRKIRRTVIDALDQVRMQFARCRRRNDDAMKLCAQIVPSLHQNFPVVFVVSALENDLMDFDSRQFIG